MLMIAELAISAMGLIMLFSGKTLGKNSVSHWQVRLVGAFWLFMLPTAFIVGIIGGIMYAIANPETAQADLESGGARWLFGLGELAFVIAYYAIGHCWMNAIKRKVAMQAPVDEWAAPSYGQWSMGPISGTPQPGHRGMQGASPTH